MGNDKSKHDCDTPQGQSGQEPDTGGVGDVGRLAEEAQTEDRERQTNSKLQAALSKLQAALSKLQAALSRLPDLATTATSLATIATFVLAYIMYLQAELTRDMVDAMRLDQRPWVGYYKHIIQARESPTSPWEDRDPKPIEEFRVRHFVRNSGTTPAFKVYAFQPDMCLAPFGQSPERPEIEVPARSDSTLTFTIFPGSELTSVNSRTERFRPEVFAEYASLRTNLHCWTRIHYCDGAGNLHWTEAELTRVFGPAPDEFAIQWSDAGTYSSEGPHPDCE